MSSIKSTLGGGQHGYLGITMRASQYERITDTPFPGNRPPPDKKRKLQVSRLLADESTMGEKSVTQEMTDFEQVELNVVRRVLLSMIYEATHEYIEYFFP